MKISDYVKNLSQQDYTKYKKQAYKLTRNEQRAEDILQEALLSCLVSDMSATHIPSYMGMVILNKVRRPNKHKEIAISSIFEDGENAWLHESSEAPRYEDRYVDNTYRLERALKTSVLKPTSKHIIRMYMKGISFENMSRALDVNVNTVKSTYRSALADLKDVLYRQGCSSVLDCMEVE